jgi:hypothetical protein
VSSRDERIAAQSDVPTPAPPAQRSGREPREVTLSSAARAERVAPAPRGDARHGLEALVVDPSPAPAAEVVERAVDRAAGLPAAAGDALTIAGVDAQPSGSPRAAVDLLLAGQTQAALDAYRAIESSSTGDGSYALVIRLLERELHDCGLPASQACGP